MDEYITLSLQDLITSGCLSKSTFLFDNEGASLSETSASFEHNCSKDLNAAKLSLVLARKFRELHSTGFINKINESLLTSLHSCDIIYVQVKCCSDVSCHYLESEETPSPSATENPARPKTPRAAPTPRVSDTSVVDIADVLESPKPSKSCQRSPSSSKSSFDAALEELFSDEEEANNRDDFQKTDESASCVVQSVKKVPISDVLQFHSIDMSKLYCTLIRAEIRCDTNRFSQCDEVSISDAIQILANLIHNVFSLGKHALSQYQKSVTPEPELDRAGVASEGLPRDSKMRKSKDENLFSLLGDSGYYPISVCRMVSDMVGSGPNHNADTSFASFDEIIHELEQMSLYPETFLHNADDSFSSTSLLFGQRFYGRTPEVTKILEIATRLETTNKSGHVETVFIAGIAGCGKTQLARRVGHFLSSLGWIVLEAKFDRCTEYESREVICSILDKLMSKFVVMKNGSNKADMEYAQRAANAISDNFDVASLSLLVDFVPSIDNLFDDIDIDKNKGRRETTHLQLIILFSELLGVILRLDRFIMICLDDLQWCDAVVFTLINEMIISVAQNELEKQHLLFVGTYRNDEIDDGTPLNSQILKLQRSNNVNFTQINVPSLSSSEICDMLMTEMKLPRRLVRKLADVIYMKTSGHAIFVIELLNLLIRNSIIAYRPSRKRLYWDINKVMSSAKTSSVASLIISNFNSLQPAVLWTLCIISCFGFKLETSLLRLLRGSSVLPVREGFGLEILVERGFVELSGSVIKFSHDLIQQHVYDKMPSHQRQKLHLDIGTILASKTKLDSAPTYQPIDATMEQLYICDGGDEQNEDSSVSIHSLSGIATTQINKAGPEFISDRSQRNRFAGWNLRAAKESAAKSNFRAALYYCKNGILFIGDVPWIIETRQLSIGLHEGAAFALFALGKWSEVAEYSNAIIDSGSVDFEQSLVAQNILIRSLEAMGHYANTIARGLAVLRCFSFDIPDAPTPVIIMQAMVQTSNIALLYRVFDHTFNPSSISGVVQPKQKNILKIIDSVAVACFQTSSPYLPLVACATVIYSLQQGIFHCEESASAFAIFGYFKVFLEGQFLEAQKWGKLAVSVLSNGYASVRARMYLYGFLYFWFIPISETCRKLYETYTIGMRCGDVDSAMYALGLHWMWQFYGGEKLSVVQTNLDDAMNLMSKYSEELRKQCLLRKIPLALLMGITDEDPYSMMEDGVYCESELLVYAKSKKKVQLLEGLFQSQFLSAFWMGDFNKAMESANDLLKLPTSKMPKVQSLYFTFYRGIASYWLFRNGDGTQLMQGGNDALSKMQSWNQACPHVENKVLLLQAEYFASQCNRNSAKEKYEASIKSARDLGFVNEQGLAYECMGKYFSSIVEIQEAKKCFRRAHECYLQWGALGKAEQIRRDHAIDQHTDNSDIRPMKHQRDLNDS